MLVFVDADVVLAPHAVAATVALLRRPGSTCVCPYPRSVAGPAAERLVQPLLQWSWLTFLPLRLAERSPRPSLAAAGGQLLAVRPGRLRPGRRARRGPGRGARGRRAGCGRSSGPAAAVGVADGTALADCRMYDGWAELRDGYTKSLWAAFGSPAGAAAVVGLLALLYVVPPLPVGWPPVRGSRRWALAGYAARGRRPGGRRPARPAAGPGRTRWRTRCRSCVARLADRAVAARLRRRAAR